MTAGNFYRESCRAALKTGVRAVLLVGRDERNQISLPKDPSLFIDEYAPYSCCSLDRPQSFIKEVSEQRHKPCEPANRWSSFPSVMINLITLIESNGWAWALGSLAARIEPTALPS